MPAQVVLQVAVIHEGQHNVRNIALEDEADHGEHVAVTEALHQHCLLQERLRRLFAASILCCLGHKCKI